MKKISLSRGEYSTLWEIFFTFMDKISFLWKNNSLRMRNIHHSETYFPIHEEKLYPWEKYTHSNGNILHLFSIHGENFFHWKKNIRIQWETFSTLRHIFFFFMKKMSFF
jgi:hypothetical protein